MPQLRFAAPATLALEDRLGVLEPEIAPVEQVSGLLAQHLLTGIAQQLLGGRADIEIVSVVAKQDDRVLGAFEQAAVTRFRCLSLPE